MSVAKRMASHLHDFLIELCEGKDRPNTRLKSLAYTHLEIAMMYLEKQADEDSESYQARMTKYDSFGVPKYVPPKTDDPL